MAVNKSKVVVAVVVVLFLGSLIGVLQLSAIENEPDADYDLEVFMEYEEQMREEMYDADGREGEKELLQYEEELLNYEGELPTYEDGGFCAAPDSSREQSLEAEVQTLQEQLQLVRAEKDELVAHVAVQHVPLACEGAGGAVWERVVGHQRVLFPSFPASGSEALMDALGLMLDSPVCSVYPERGGDAWNAELGIREGDVVECRCVADCEVFSGAPAPISTYFPTITQQVAIPTVDKVLLVVRNPVDNIEAFWRMCQEKSWLASRRRAWKWHFEKEIGEYKKFHDFWDRYADTLGVMFQAVKYEDLCSNPLATLDAIFSFLDVPKKRINWARAEELRLADFCLSFEETENGVKRYTEGQGEKVTTVLAHILEKYDYGELMAQYAASWAGVPDE